MSDILCVTSRSLCSGDFLEQVARIAAAVPAGLILREKDLAPEAYTELAGKVLEICRNHKTLCILHTYPETALRLDCPALHMPLPLLEKMTEKERTRFSVLGASCHSVTDARRARELGCTYITAGHVFTTQCKPGLAPRGLPFLREICAAVDIPVYAIGGISPQNISLVRENGASGACVMSGLMKTAEPARLLKELAAGKTENAPV